jgi:hypothetical protein
MSRHYVKLFSFPGSSLGTPSGRLYPGLTGTRGMSFASLTASYSSFI